MTDVNEIIEALRTALAANEKREYDRGYADGFAAAKSKILEAIGNDQKDRQPIQAPDISPNIVGSRNANSPRATTERQRAPRGLPRALTTRVLRANPEGATPQNIVDAAETDFEKMIAISSIRSELRRGEDDGRYFDGGGVWFLLDKAEAEGQESILNPSASEDMNKGGKPNAAALD